MGKSIKGRSEEEMRADRLDYEAGRPKVKKPRYQPTIPQNIMRADMERAASVAIQGARDVEAAEPKLMSLGTVLDEVVGPQSELSRDGVISRRATEMVYDIINEHELTLSLKQWNTVQAMMEKAILAGVQLERAV